MLKCNLRSEASQKAILNIFQNICWIIETGQEGSLECLIPCTDEHIFQAWCDEAGKTVFYLSYFKYHKPNRNYQIEKLTPKTYADQRIIEEIINTLISDKLLNVGSYKNEYELYITRINRHDYNISIYPTLKVFAVGDKNDADNYNEWQSVLSRLSRGPSF